MLKGDLQRELLRNTREMTDVLEITFCISGQCALWPNVSVLYVFVCAYVRACFLDIQADFFFLRIPLDVFQIVPR